MSRTADGMWDGKSISRVNKVLGEGKCLRRNYWINFISTRNHFDGVSIEMKSSNYPTISFVLTTNKLNQRGNWGNIEEENSLREIAQPELIWN